MAGRDVWTAHRESQAAGTALLLGSVFMVHQYAQQAGGVVTAIASHDQGFARHRADFASAVPIFASARSQPPHGQSPASPDALDQTRPPAARPDWRHIRLCGLHFSHPTRRDPDRPTLDGLELTLTRGDRIALVGESGSGKTSLLRVLAGLYAGTSDRVDIDTAPATLQAIASRATLIPQDAEVFEGTLRENLQMTGVTDEALLHEALRIACLDVWLASLALGLDTPLTERGRNLFGGQRQRIAFARALLAARSDDLLLLDEVSSSLDASTEAAVFERLFAARPDAAIIASVHRLHLLGRFDEVWWLVDGRLADRGAPDAIAGRHAGFRRRLRAAAREA